MRVISRSVKEQGKRVLRRIFELLQRAGLNVLPMRFYSSIPDIRWLRGTTDWRKPMSMTGISGVEIESQLTTLADWCTEELRAELLDRKVYEEAVALQGEGVGYGPIEAKVLYCFIRSQQPTRVVQVGCGVSTAIILRAAQDEGTQVNITCVEPFPSEFLLNAAVAGHIDLVQEKAQTVDISLFRQLEAGDLLFVDSTHTVKVGSEVNRIVLELLPQIEDGVHVHFHDIYFPYDYGRSVLAEDLYFWTESTLLHAFLINNSRFSITVSESMLHYLATNRLLDYFRDYRPQGNDDGMTDESGEHFPSSTWIRSHGPTSS